MGIGWRETRSRLRADRERLRAHVRAKFRYCPRFLIFDPSYACLVVHRLSAYFWGRNQFLFGRSLTQFNLLVFGVDIHPASDIDGGLLLPFPFGIMMSGKVGRNMTVMALSGTGAMFVEKDIGAGKGLPVVGDDAVLYQLSGVMGATRVGARVRVRHAALLHTDVGDDTVVTCEVASEAPTQSPTSLESPAPQCTHGRLGSTISDIRADLGRYLDERTGHVQNEKSIIRLLSAFTTNQCLVLSIHRLSHFLHVNGWKRLAAALAHWNVLVSKATIYPAACIGGGAFMPHPAGTVLSARLGRNVTLYGHALCVPSSADIGDVEDQPVLGDGVTVSGHSGVFGAVTIGDGTRVAANVRVTHDIGPALRVFSSMTRTATHPRPADVILASSAEPTKLLRKESVARLRELIHADKARLEQRDISKDGKSSNSSYFPAFMCVLLFRLSHFFFSRGHYHLARWCWLANFYLTGCDIAPASMIGGGLYIPQPAAVSIECVAGTGLTVLALAGVGRSPRDDSPDFQLSDAPELGDDVLVGYHAGIYGGVRVGDNVRVGPGCIVESDLTDGAELVPPPLTIRPAKQPVKQ